MRQAVKEESVSFMMLFCALILVKRGKASMGESLTMAPLFGQAKLLAGAMVSPTA